MNHEVKAMQYAPVCAVAVLTVCCCAGVVLAAGPSVGAISGAGDLASLVGRPADVAGSAYLYRADRNAGDNPPEAWILMIQHAGLPYTERVDVSAPAVRQALCGLLWEEVRPIRRVELTWAENDSSRRPGSDEFAVTYFDAAGGQAHTWWNPLTKKDAAKPDVSADGRTYAYAVPADTWGVVVSVRGQKDAKAYAAPAVRAFVADTWKPMDLEIEWGFDDARAGMDYGGRVEPYDAVLADVRPLAGDTATALTGPLEWRSAGKGVARRGVRMSVLYVGSSRWRAVWPYHAQPEDVARSILTVWTRSGGFSPTATGA